MPAWCSFRSASAGRALVAAALLLALTGCARAGGEPFQPIHNSTVAIEPGEPVGQTVNPVGDVLTGVDVTFATYARPADPTGTVTVTVTDPATGEQLGSAVVPGEDLRDVTWRRVPFEPAVRSDGALLVEFAWDGATPLALLADTPLDDGGDGPSPRGAADAAMVNDPYPAGSLVVNGEPAPGDLAFRVRGEGGVGAAAGQLAEVVASAGARLRAEPLFALAWLLALAGCAWLVVRGFRTRAR